MIPQKIQALFDFIDYLDTNKTEYIEKYIPLCSELKDLDNQRAKLKPNQNYIDKQLSDKLTNQITQKFQPIEQHIYVPILNKLRELEIWAGDDVYTSIWNNNMSAISDFKRDFLEEDVFQVMEYKRKYLSFRTETNSNFLSLQFVFSNLDEILKELFDFLKDTNENEFSGFEARTIKVDNIENALKGFRTAKGENVKFSLPFDYFTRRTNDKIIPPINTTHITTKIIMGDNFQIGDINNNSGQIAIGKGIKISNSSDGKNETADKILELINLIKQAPDIDEQQKQSLITNFDNVKSEIFKPQPAKSKIFGWLSNTKVILENLVLTHHVTEAAHWVYEN